MQGRSNWQGGAARRPVLLLSRVNTHDSLAFLRYELGAHQVLRAHGMPALALRLAGRAMPFPEWLGRFPLDPAHLSGLIAIYPESEWLPVLREWATPQFPVISLGVDVAGLPSALTDWSAGAHLVLDHLKRQGHERIAFLPSGFVEAEPIADSAGLEAGYREWAPQLGLDADPDLILDPAETPPVANARVVELAGWAAPPTGLIVTSEWLGLGAWNGTQTLNWDVPERLALVAAGSAAPVHLTKPRLSGLVKPEYALGRLGAQWVIEAVGRGGCEPERRVRVKPALILRGSCGAPRPSHAAALRSYLTPIFAAILNLDAPASQAADWGEQVADCVNDPAALAAALPCQIEGLREAGLDPMESDHVLDAVRSVLLKERRAGRRAALLAALDVVRRDAARQFACSVRGVWHPFNLAHSYDWAESRWDKLGFERLAHLTSPSLPMLHGGVRLLLRDDSGDPSRPELQVWEVADGNVPEQPLWSGAAADLDMQAALPGDSIDRPIAAHPFQLSPTRSGVVLFRVPRFLTRLLPDASAPAYVVQSDFRIQTYVEELNEARREADRANRAKSEFLASMSHDLRTPLHGIVGFVDLALESGNTTEQRDFLQQAKGLAGSLMALIDNILCFAQSEGRRGEEPAAPFDVRAAVERAFYSVAVEADKKGLALGCYIAPDVPRRVVGRFDEFTRVLVNLLGNAVKFTERGHVILRLGTIPNGAPEGSVRLRGSVEDTGIGIAPDQHSLIFERFVRSDDLDDAAPTGSGLGLAICARLVESMQGRIWLDSALDRGSHFHFEVTLAAPLDRDDGETQMPAKAETAAPFKTLVIHPEPAIAELWRQTLQDHGRLADLRPPGQTDELETFLSEHTYHLILGDAADAHLGAVTRRLAPKRLLVGSRRHRGDPVSGDVVIQSPVFPWTLLAACDTARHAGSRPDPDPHLQPTAADPRAAVSPRILIIDDHAINRELSVALLARRGYRSEALRSALDALARIDSEHFDAVLVDLDMPDMDGLTFARNVRERERNASRRRLPLVALTGATSDEQHRACESAGMDGVVVKPASADELVAALNRAMTAQTTDAGGSGDRPGGIRTLAKWR